MKQEKNSLNPPKLLSQRIRKRYHKLWRIAIVNKQTNITNFTKLHKTYSTYSKDKFRERKETMDCLLHLSPNFNNNVFLFVVLRTLGIFVKFYLVE